MLVHHCRLLVAVAVSILFIGQASAATLTTFTDRPTFLAAASGIVISEDLNSIVSDIDTQPGPPIDVGPFSMSAVGPEAGNNGIDASPFGNVGGNNRNVDGTTYLNGDINVAGTVITLSFDSLLEGFAFEGESTQDGPVNLNIAGATVTVPSDGFFGVISDMPFNSLTIDGGDGAFGLDNFDLAQTAVPEPGSIVIWTLLGFVGIVFALRRRRAA